MRASMASNRVCCPLLFVLAVGLTGSVHGLYDLYEENPHKTDTDTDSGHEEDTLPEGSNGLELCGTEILCLQHFQGLPLSRIASKTDRIARTWAETTRLYKLKAAGSWTFMTRGFPCQLFLFGFEKSMKVGSFQVSQYAASGFFLAFVCFFFAFSWMVAGIIIVPKLPSPIKEYLDVPYQVIVLMFALAGIFLYLYGAAELKEFSILFGSTVEPYCKASYGPDMLMKTGNPAWIAAMNERAHTTWSENYALFSKPADAEKIGLGVQAAALKVYNLEGGFSSEVAAACSGVGGGSSTSSPLPALTDWLLAGGFECQAVNDAVRNRATIYISHPMMSIHVAPILDAEHASKIVELAEQHGARWGWTKKRHSNYATTDIPVWRSKALKGYIDGLDLEQRMASSVAQTFGIGGESGFGLRHIESFVVKYAVDCSGPGCGQAELDFHSDGDDGSTAVSFSVLLNQAKDFEGGGTMFASFGNRSVEIDQGMATLHSSRFSHGGAKVESGTRYILVGFMEYPSLLSPVQSLLRRVTEQLLNLGGHDNFAEWSAALKARQQQSEL